MRQFGSLIFLTAIILCIGGCSQTPVQEFGASASALPTSRVVAEPTTAPQITWQDLNDHPVIGKLGLPLGTVADLRAVVVSGDSLGDKGDAGQYLLRITEINGMKVDRNCVLQFSVPGYVQSQLISDTVELYKRKKDAEPGSLTKADLKILEQAYVGSAVHLGAYESGSYSGIPTNYPAIGQDHGWDFTTYLIVIADRN